MSEECLPEAHGRVRLIFGIDAFPSLGLPAVPGVIDVRVPLTAKLALSCGDEGLRRSAEWGALSLDDHRSLRAELDVCWSQFLDGAGGDDHFSRFHFDLWQVNVLYLRLFLRRVLAETRPVSVSIPSMEVASLADCRDDGARARWVMQKVIEEETQGIDARTTFGVDEAPLAPHVRWREAPWARRVRRSVALRRARRALCGSRRLTGFARRRAVLLIAQRAKVAEIRRLHTSAGRPILIPYELLGTLYPPDGEPDGSGADFSGQACESQLWGWLRTEASFVRASASLAKAVVESRPRAVMTDAEHDVRIRNLLVACVQAEIPVAVVPEGAVAHVGNQSEFVGQLRFDSPGIEYFSRNVKEAAVRVTSGASPERVHVSGYLGDTRRPGWRRTVKGALLEHSLGSARRGKKVADLVVGLSLDTLFSGILIQRPADTPHLEALAANMQLLHALSDSGIRVLVSPRQAVVGRAVAERFPMANVDIAIHRPWQWVAKQATAMIVMNTSIAWESLALGVPVILVRVGGVESASEATLSDTPGDWVTVAESLGDVVSAVRRIARLRANGRFLGPPPVRSMPDHVAKWLNSL